MIFLLGASSPVFLHYPREARLAHSVLTPGGHLCHVAISSKVVNLLSECSVNYPFIFDSEDLPRCLARSRHMQ